MDYLIISKQGKVLRINGNDIEVLDSKQAGSPVMTLTGTDSIVGVVPIESNEGYVGIISQFATMKFVKVSEFKNKGLNTIGEQIKIGRRGQEPISYVFYTEINY